MGFQGHPVTVGLSLWGLCLGLFAAFGWGSCPGSLCQVSSCWKEFLVFAVGSGESTGCERVSEGNSFFPSVLGGSNLHTEVPNWCYLPHR